MWTSAEWLCWQGWLAGWAIPFLRRSSRKHATQLRAQVEAARAEVTVLKEARQALQLQLAARKTERDQAKEVKQRAVVIVAVALDNDAACPCLWAIFDVVQP